MRALVRATANVIGLVRGDTAYVEVGPLVDGLIEGGFLQWIDAPAPTFEQYDTTEVVKNRAQRESSEDAGTEALVSSESAPYTYEEWLEDGGNPGADD